MPHQPCLPAALLAVLFLGWEIRELFILGYCWGRREKSHIANFPEMYEGGMTDKAGNQESLSFKDTA